MSLTADARRLLAAAWRLAPRRVMLQVALLLGTGLVGGANLLLLIPVVNSLAATGAGQPISVPALGGLSLAGWPLSLLLAGIVALTAGQAALQRASTINSTLVNQTVVDHLRGEAFAAILAARWAFVLDQQRSDIVNVVTLGATRSGMALGQLLSGAVTLVIAVATAVVALLVEPALSAIAILGTLVLGAALATSLRPAYRMGTLYSLRSRRLQSLMTDSLDSLRLVRAHDAAEVWAQQLAEGFADSREIQVANARRTATVTALSQVGLVLAASMLVLAAVWLEVPPTTIVVVLILTARLARLMQSLAGTAQLAANSLPAVRDIEDLTRAARAAAEVLDPVVGRAPALDGGAVPEPTPPGAALVSLEDVSFHYPSSGGGVEGITLQVAAGSVTALTGASGAGKSTVADIVLGLLEPDSGVVKVSGVPLAHAGLRNWRARIAYVPQETVLIPGSLRRNLVWSVDRASDDQCWSALDRAAARFARELPDGLDTELGDRGIRLSGGERQRVAIARALLRRPDLLVLDEATSSLDDSTEAEILSLMSRLTPAVTVLVIAHRRSTIEAADHVVVLDRGRVVSGDAGPARADLA